MEIESYKQCIESYEISNFGNLRKKLKNGEYKNVKGSILNSGGGYKYFQINRGNKRTNHLFHHLVANAFIGERPENLVIDHIDRNSLNNNVNNLRYVSYKENSRNSSIFKSHIEGEGKERHYKVCKEYALNNKEYLKEQKIKYYEKNKEKITQYLKDRYIKKRESILEYQKEYALNNKDKISKRNIEWNLKNKMTINCECGYTYKKYNKSKHLKTKKHLQH